MLLQLERLTRRFAGLVAVDGVDMAVAAGGVHAVIGPNGAGKTTLFNLVSGLVRPSSGRIVLEGMEVSGLAPERRAGLGLGRTFQNIRIFSSMTVLENVLTGLHDADAGGAGGGDVAATGVPGGGAGGGGAGAGGAGRGGAGGCGGSGWRGRCRMGISGAWRSRGRWWRSRSCCCWTSRRRG